MISKCILLKGIVLSKLKGFFKTNQGRVLTQFIKDTNLEESGI